MQLYKTEGLVVHCRDSGQSDKSLTVITRELGKIYVHARGARKLTSKFLSASQLFAYSSFVVDMKDGKAILHEADVINSFFGLRTSVTKMALASYFADVLDNISVQKNDDDGSLNLTLNCLYLLSEDKKDESLIKAVFEMKICECIGLYPDISGCDICGKDGEEAWYLDVMNGRLLCSGCLHGMQKENNGNNGDAFGEASLMIPVTKAELSVMQRILYSDAKRAFSFKADEGLLKRVSGITEAYLQSMLECEIKSLKFYKDLA